MIKAAIVEDDPRHVQNLEEYLKKYGEDHKTEFSVTVFGNGIDFLSRYDLSTDIVFMDIRMPHMNGMDCAKRLREMDAEVFLIFVTDMVQYAVHGYEVEAIGYMVKPIKYFPFSILLDKVLSRIESQEKNDILVTTKDYSRRIPLRDLCFVEISDHYLVYHTSSGEVREIGKMKDMEDKLSGHGFFRVSNSHLVNLRHVEGVEEDAALVNGETVFISRRRKKEFLEALNDYMKEGGR